MSDFRWTAKREQAAALLANGHTQQEISREIGITDRSIRRWLNDPEFEAEVDRLSVMTDIAGRAYRLRMAKRIVRQKQKQNGDLSTSRDLLDWLRYAQSETDGVELDLTTLLEAYTSVAGDG